MAIDDLTSRYDMPGRGAPSQSLPVAGGAAEWTAQTLRPVAHWVLMPGERGAGRLTMVWETPNPLPPG